MKRFLIATGLISLTGSFLFHHLFNYKITTVLYHLTVIVSFLVFMVVVNILLSRVRKPALAGFLMNIFNFVFLFSLVIFYLAILGSNYMWGKTITFKIFSDYLFSIDDLVDVLPVSAWIFYAAFIALFIVIVLLFMLVRPKVVVVPLWLHTVFSDRKKRFRFTIILLLLSAVGLVFRKEIMTYKTVMHFAEEPVLEFVLGPMWYPESLNDVYNSKRQKNSLKERDCIARVTPLPGNNRPHMTVIVLVDALRNDHLPMYGYERMTTPFMDSLSKAGQLLTVKRAFSTSSGTLIGVAGLFSSKNWEDFGYTGLNLMKFMNRINHNTYAFLTGHHRTWYGLTTIYKNDCNFFYESATSYSQVDLNDLTTLAKIQNTAFEKNSFIYIHLLSVHDLGKKNEQFRKFLPDKIDLGTDKKTALINNYDNGILQVDYFMRKLFEKLKREGHLDNTTIYFLSDHGQMFGEFGQWNHANSINPVVISIPLLIYDSDLSWYKNREAATLKDVAPTIADRLGYPIPACWEGHSLGEPLKDFSIKINVENKCDLPEGILINNNGNLTLDLLNEEKKIKMKAVLPKDSADWRIEEIKNR